MAETPTTPDQGDERRAFDLYWLARQPHRGFGAALTDAEMLSHPEDRADEFLAWQAARALSAAQPVAQEAILKEVVGCFEAALAEGLQETLAETKDERLKDLVERRLMHAMTAALAAPQPSQGAEPDWYRSEVLRAGDEGYAQGLIDGAASHRPASAEAGEGVEDCFDRKKLMCRVVNQAVESGVISENEGIHLALAPSESVAVVTAPAVDWQALYRRMRDVAAGYSNLADETASSRRLDKEFEAIEQEARK